MDPRVLSCPRCGAPIQVGDAGRVQCKFCGSELDLGLESLLRHYLEKPRPVDQAPRIEEQRSRENIGADAAPPRAEPAALSALRRGLKVISGPIFGLLAGLLAMQAAVVFMKNGGHPNAILVSVLLAPIVIALAATGRKVQGALLAASTGALFAVKPFARPVTMQDGFVFGPTSETHLNYLIPGALLVVVAMIIALTLKRDDAPKKPRFGLIALGAIAFGVGVAFAASALLGETNQEVIARYRPRFEAMRATWKTISAKIPAEGDVADKVKRDLKPQPVSGQFKLKANTEIVPFNQVADPEARPTYDLIASSYLLRGMLYTGPKNPMSETILYDKSERLAGELEDALAYRYLVVYRGINPRSPSSVPSEADRIEVFVFDLTTTEMVASFSSSKVGTYTEGRQTLAKGLERATGGKFDLN